MMGGQTDYNLSCFPGDPTTPSSLPPTWRKLEEIEVKRREILDRAEMPFLRIVLSWNGTCLRALCFDWLIWLPIGIYVTVRILARKFELVDILADSNIDILGGFLSFFLVLFVNQTNGRFFEMYTMAKGVTGKMVEVASTAVTKFSPAASARLVRYMNAAHTLGYVGLDGPYSKEHFFNHINQEYNLLTKSEMEIIGRRGWNFDGFLELMTWCQYDVRKAQKAGMIDSGEARELNGLLLGMKANMKGIYNYCDQPVHFFYIHFLCLLSALYLPLFALENALSVSNDHWSSELTTATIVILQSTFVIGLRLLGQKMVDPFGDDLEDLSVLSYVVGTIKDCRLVLTSHEGSDVDEQLEMSLATEAFSMTKAQI